VSLAHALEEAAQAQPELADAIRPANGDPGRLREALSPEQATEVLAWLLAERSEAGEERAEAWAAEPEGAAVLAAISEASLSKSGRKALRRLRHRLRSRGVELPEGEPAPRVATLPELDDRMAGARVSPLDPSGARIVYLVEPHPQGGTRLFEVVLDEARGLLGFDVYGAPRRKARAFLRELEGRPRFPVVEVEEEGGLGGEVEGGVEGDGGAGGDGAGLLLVLEDFGEAGGGQIDGVVVAVDGDHDGLVGEDAEVDVGVVFGNEVDELAVVDGLGLLAPEVELAGVVEDVALLLRA